MTTPEQARELSDFISDVAWSEPGPLCNNKFDKAAEALTDLANQVETLQADAERYKWLRDNSAGQWENPICVEQNKSDWGMRYIGPLTGSSLDNAIDAARKAK